MRLTDLVRDVPVREIRGDANIDITSVTPDSRLVRKGSLFIAIPGTAQDGVAFVPQALEKGAAAIGVRSSLFGSVGQEGVGPSFFASGGDKRRPDPKTEERRPDPSTENAQTEERRSDPTQTTVLLLDDPREGLSLLAANFFGRPVDRLSLVGVTGTSGKTTTTRMVEAIFDAGGGAVGLVGTIEYRAGEERLVADRTTPDAAVLQEWFAKMVAAGVRHAVMEVSSHALALKRVYGVRFAAAVFTNLSREHFDFHGDFEDYFAAKRILFDQIDRNRRTAVVNVDDPYGRRLAADLGTTAMTFGRDPNADIRPAEDFGITVDGLSGRVTTPRGEVRIESKLIGLPNLYNWLGAIGAAIAVDIPTDQIEAGIRNLATVRGRFERVGEGGPTVLVDYAHKPDALEKLLLTVRDIAGDRKVRLLFGCGGDRDRGKRPQMGEIATRLADEVIVTSDNPRSEEPQAIIDEVKKGMVGRRFAEIVDRREAIERAIADAQDDDFVVIAGKGHETYQLIGDRVEHFDDREEAEIALRKRSKKASL